MPLYLFQSKVSSQYTVNNVSVPPFGSHHGRAESEAIRASPKRWLLPQEVRGALLLLGGVRKAREMLSSGTPLFLSFFHTTVETLIACSCCHLCPGRHDDFIDPLNTGPAALLLPGSAAVPGSFIRHSVAFSQLSSLPTFEKGSVDGFYSSPFLQTSSALKQQ